jgi:hypothetical protein
MTGWMRDPQAKRETWRMTLGPHTVELVYDPKDWTGKAWFASIRRPPFQYWAVERQHTRLDAETAAMQFLHELVKVEAEAVEAWNRDIIARRYAQAGHDPAELGYTSSDLLPIPKGS